MNGVRDPNAVRPIVAFGVAKKIKFISFKNEISDLVQKKNPTNSQLVLSFPSVARRRVVTCNAGSRVADLFQHVLKQSHERGLKRITTLTLPLGQHHLYEVVDVRYG